MCCADLFRAVILQAMRDAAAPIPARLPKRPPPGLQWRETSNAVSLAQVWRRRREANAERIAEVREYRDSARRWLTMWSEDFVLVCHAAGIDHGSVMSHAARMAERGWPQEAIAGLP